MANHGIQRTGKRFAIGLLVPLMVCICQCTSLTSGDLIGQEEYAESQFWFSDYDYQRALQDFPAGEQGGFLTTVEKGYLGLLAGQPDIQALRAIADKLESRRMIKVTTEVESFLYKETEDRYFPAEHEAILLHVLTGLAYAAKGMPSETHIEAKRAAIYLEQQFGRDNNFDDPFLRLLIAGLFISTGNWAEAKVDFRVAADFMPQWPQLKHIAEQAQPPKDIVILFSGNGAKAQNAVGDLGVEMTAAKVAPAQITFDGQPVKSIIHRHDLWYKRHLVRDRAVKQILDQTKRAIDSAGSHTLAGARAATGIATGVAIGALGIGAGIYIAVLGGGSEVPVALGLVVGGAGYVSGKKIADASLDDAEEILERGDARARYYRFLRFLPQQSQFAISDQPRQVVVRSSTGKEVKPFLTLGNVNTTRIRYYHVSDEGNAHLASKKLLRYWRNGNQLWQMGSQKTTASTAYVNCDIMQTVLQKNKHYGATSADEAAFLAALHQGIAKEATNSLFAGDMQRLKWFWCFENSSKDKCKRCRIDGKVEMVSCSEPTTPLCVVEPW